jgi:hypothetical protein
MGKIGEDLMSVGKFDEIQRNSVSVVARPVPDILFIFSDTVSAIDQKNSPARIRLGIEIILP